ncbi:MAG: alpha/beta hydrolase-fold protein, partial [Sphingomicrobium sp.]
MIRALALALLLLLTAPVSAQQVSAGTIVDLGVIHSRHADPRKVVVWLPPGYRAHGPKYSVLYMHDGQNLFDTATASYGKEWRIDETLSRLIREKKVRPTIVVGIWSTDKRLREYVPAKVFARLPASFMDRISAIYGGAPLSDGYLKFLTRELRPMINRRFNVRTDRANTLIMGSSMGGLISLYAIDEYPQLFGGAGMLSTHWPLFLPPPGTKEMPDPDYATVARAFDRYLAPALPSPATHLLYFDHGSETLDALYARNQQRVDRIVARRGYRPGRNWITRNFPGQAHDENSWASRVEIPLRFLLPPR